MGYISQTVPEPALRFVRGVLRTLTGKPQVGKVSFGHLRHTRPVCSNFGVSRGLPVDRYYIENFLHANKTHIHGKVLEIGENTYTRRFGESRVETSDILHVSDNNPEATIVANLENAPQIPDASFDCIILTQTLQLIFRPEAAVRTLHRILKPGGVVLVTVPGITQIATRSEWGPTWYWSFTERCVLRMFGELFGEDGITSQVHGNVLAATAQLQGLASSELSPDELADIDPDYQVIITACAVKGGGVR